MVMETERRQVTQVQNLKHSNVKFCSRHRRTKSDSDKINLKPQFGSTAKSVSSTQDIMSIPESDTEELVREIALLELEVMYLEQYLLSLYRRAFDHQVLTLSSSSGGKLTRSWNSHSKMIEPDSTLGASSRKEDIRHLCFRETMNQNSTIKVVPQDDDRYINAWFSQRATCSARISSFNESFARATYSCHSPPLSFHKEEKNDASRVISLAEYLGANIDDHVPETPNRLSEQMVRCMTAMFFKLADPPMVCHGPPSSPVSLPSSVSVLSPIQQTNSPIHKHGAFDSWLINAFQAKGLNELSGAHTDTCTVEVPSISRDPWRLRGVEDMLQNYKSLLGRLKAVDPTKMKHEEKLAFWVNVHNALVMHAYVECGIPQDNTSKASLLFKASCTIGNCVVNATIIRGSILCCRTHVLDKAFNHCSTQDSKTRLEIVGIDMPSNNKNLFFISHYVPAVTPILQSEYIAPRECFNNWRLRKKSIFKQLSGFARKRRSLFQRL